MAIPGINFRVSQTRDAVGGPWFNYVYEFLEKREI